MKNITAQTFWAARYTAHSRNLILDELTVDELTASRYFVGDRPIRPTPFGPCIPAHPNWAAQAYPNWVISAILLVVLYPW